MLIELGLHMFNATLNKIWKLIAALSFIGGGKQCT
jgi:hypothetical protein